MATLEQAQKDIITAYEAARLAWAGAAFDTQYPGQVTIDPLTQVRPFVAIDFDIHTGRQLDLGPVPMSRWDGNFIIAVAVKCGSGYMQAARLVDYFTGALELRRLGVAQVEAATAARMKEHQGWDYRPLVLPFWLTRFKQ
jgi:hypothetical protein